MTADLWLDSLRASHARLSATLDSLSDAEMAGPSYHSWSIAQVASHLGSQAELWSLFLEAGLAGDEPPGVDAFRPVWDRWDAKSPAEQARDYVEAEKVFEDQVAGLDDEQRAAWRLSLFGAEQDLAGLLRLRLGEHAVHTWDVVVATDPGATVSPDAVALLAESVPGLVARAGQPVDQPTSITVVTTAPDRTFRLELTADGATLSEDGSAGAGGATLTMPTEALLRLAYGRLDAEHTPADVHAEGVDLDALRRTFPGF